MRELYEADFHKPGIYESGQVWSNAWNVFRRAPSRGCRGRRAAVDFVVCFGWGGFFRVFFPGFFFFERTRPGANMRPPCLIYLSTRNEARPRERSDRGRFLPIGKKASYYRGAYRVPLFSLCVCQCVTFVVFTDCESCTKPISTNPGSMEAGERRLTRGTCFITCRLEVVAVAGLMWISRCVFLGAIFFSVLSIRLHFQIHS